VISSSKDKIEEIPVYKWQGGPDKNHRKFWGDSIVSMYKYTIEKRFKTIILDSQKMKRDKYIPALKITSTAQDFLKFVENK